MAKMTRSSLKEKLSPDNAVYNGRGGVANSAGRVMFGGWFGLALIAFVKPLGDR
jgi:hypothetical protein